MRGGEKGGAYNKFRFIWKAQVNASIHLSRGAKLLATRLCDKHVNRDTGLCWPRNDTLAAELAVSERTVQRGINNLKAASFLQPVKLKNIRRTFLITLPNSPDGDKEHDNLSPSSMTKRTSEDDKTVAPYRNQVNNQRRARLASTSFPTVSIGNGEEKILGHWTNWMKENLEYDVSKMFELLRKGSSFFFPARFPKSDDSPIYHRFFRAVLESNGSILPGKSG